MISAAGLSAVLVDIEGTTTPISFVHGVLFPFAEKRLGAACARAARDPELAAAVEQLRAEQCAERARGERVPDFDDGAAYARHLMRLDRKSTALKALQGLIWREGYQSGELRSPLFSDVPVALRAWRASGVRLRVFSSGSVLAQRLLFAHTDQGDLTDLFEDFHDTTTGSKRDPRSYDTIAGAFELSSASILFLSDTVDELDAAAAAGLHTGWVRRPGNAEGRGAGHPQLSSFTEVTGF
jgi:enolase-phosphatase E1